VVRVEVVVFDLGGVVCNFKPHARLSALAEATGLDEDHIKDAIWTSGLDSALDRGEFGLQGALATVIDALEQRVDEAALLTAWAKAFVVDPAVAALAGGLDRQSAIFTNNGPILEECLRRGLVPVSDIFNPILFACHLGALKPESRSFAQAAAALGHEPPELMLVDDDAANVAGALRSGWRAIQFESTAQLGQELLAAEVSS
jgi:HAD superfamily hydrolase (TIGR01509 family)